MIITLTGNNCYLMRQRLDELTGEFVKKYGDFSLEKIDAEEADLEAILDAVQSMPLLSERKMVVVRDLSASKVVAEATEQIISSISDSTDLIFYEPLTDKRTIFYKTLKSKTKLEEYTELDARGLAKWLVSEANEREGSLQINDANYLVERVGANQLLLANELEKLLTYSPKIGRESIDLLTEPTPQSKIFDLLDAAFSGNKKRALKLYEEQRAQKVEPQAILALIGWQLRLLALAKYSGERKPGDIAREAGLNPYPVNKALSLVSKLSEEKLRRMVSEAVDIDYKGKSVALDMNEALKTYITTL